MKQLVLTKIDKSSIKKKSNLFFLGNWCYDSVDEYKKLQTNDYHWDDKIKRNKDYAYLKLLYENVLNDLSEQLELYHNTKKNKRYWRIILGPWLFSFIFSIFDRFEIIKKISNEKNLYLIKFLNIFETENIFTYESYFKMVDDEWNYFIFLDLIEKFTNIKIVNQDSFLPNYNKQNLFDTSFNKEKKYYLKKILTSFFDFKNQNFFIHGSHLSKKELLILYLKHRQYPNFTSFDFTTKLYNKFSQDIGNSNYKKFFFKAHSTNDFENYIFNNVYNFIPRIFTQKFVLAQKYLKDFNLPSNPKIIYTNNSFFFNDLFNIYTAEKTMNNTKYYIGQHGGGYQITKYNFRENHEFKICDKYLSWGKNSHKKSICTGILKSNKFFKSKICFENNKDILFVTNAWELYGTWSSFELNASSYFDYNVKKKLFFNNTNSQINKNIKIRLYQHASYEFQKKFWKKNYSNLKIDYGKDLILNKLKNAKVIIVDFLHGTTLLESLYLNIPTIIINHDNIFRISEQSIKYFNLLKESNIYFDSYSEAAKHINKNYVHVNKWWLRDKTVYAKQQFLKKYCEPIDKLCFSNIFNENNLY